MALLSVILLGVTTLPSSAEESLTGLTNVATIPNPGKHTDSRVGMSEGLVVQMRADLDNDSKIEVVSFDLKSGTKKFIDIPAVSARVLSADGSRVITMVSGRFFGPEALFDTRTGKKLADLPRQKAGALDSRFIFFSLAASQLGSDTVDVTHAIYDYETKGIAKEKKQRMSMRAHRDIFGPSHLLIDQGRKVVTVKDDKKLLIWDWRSDTKVEVKAVAISNSAKLVAMEDKDKDGDESIITVSTIDGETIHTFETELLSRFVTNLAFSPDDSFLAAVSVGKILIFDLKSGDIIARVEREFGAEKIKRGFFATDDPSLFGALTYGSVKAWKLDAREK